MYHEAFQRMVNLNGEPRSYTNPHQILDELKEELPEILLTLGAKPSSVYATVLKAVNTSAESLLVSSTAPLSSSKFDQPGLVEIRPTGCSGWEGNPCCRKQLLGQEGLEPHRKAARSCVQFSPLGHQNALYIWNIFQMHTHGWLARDV
jgi:hypothetical protein